MIKYHVSAVFRLAPNHPTAATKQVIKSLSDFLYDVPLLPDVSANQDGTSGQAGLKTSLSIPATNMM